MISTLNTFMTMNHFMLVAAGAALLMTASVSCNKFGGDDDNPYKELKLSTKSAEFVRKGSGFTFEYIDRINACVDEDYIISPLSLQFLLGMILNGAQNATADEICSVLGYGAGETEAVNAYCLSMLEQLPELDKKTKLSIANAIFVQQGYPLSDSFKKRVADHYRAELANLDFSDGAGSLKEINGWCSRQTNGLIPKVLDNVDPNMLAYLLNAMYFKGQWKDKFPKGATAEELFTDESGTRGKVKMMKQKELFTYTENEVFQAVRMPYGNGAFSMIALLPQAGHTVAEITAMLKTVDWDGFRYGMDDRMVDLWLPRFETKFHIQLKEILSAMGMPLAFNPQADFLAMSDYALCLGFVQQDAVIKVDEEGTEAAVVSSSGMMMDSAPAPSLPVVFHADHPFLYLIEESSSGAVLFAGRYGGK